MLPRQSIYWLKRFVLVLMLAALGSCSQSSPKPIAHDAVIDTETACDDGVLLVFIHGWAGSTALWDNTVERLPAGYKHLTIGLAGFGHRRHIASEFHYDALLKDVADQLHRKSSCQRVVLIGHSLGGMIAQDVSALHSSKVEAMILISAQDRTKRVVLSESSMSLAKSISDAESKRRAIDRVLPRYFKDPTKTEDAFELARTESLLASPDALRNSFLSLAELEPIANDAFRQIKIPVLVISGESDIVPLSASQTLSDRYPNSCNLTIENAGHMLFLENEDQWMTVLRNFLHGALPQSEGSDWCQQLSQ